MKQIPRRNSARPGLFGAAAAFSEIEILDRLRAGITDVDWLVLRRQLCDHMTTARPQLTPEQAVGIAEAYRKRPQLIPSRRPLSPVEP